MKVETSTQLKSPKLWLVGMAFGVIAFVVSKHLAADEPAFVGRQINIGAALLLVALGTILAVVATTLFRKLSSKHLGFIFMATALGTFSGAVAGWLWRTGQPLYVAP